MHLGKTAGGGNVDGAFIYAVPFLQTFGVILLAFEALEQARVAKRLIDAGGLTAARATLCKGKLLNLDFYVSHLLPRAVATAKTVQSGDESCMDPSLFV